MKFLNSYKRLDNLCKDIFKSEKGISTYIEEMERTSSAKFKVQNWDNDYKKLKHYRYIRNQIVHDNYATEDNMCDNFDIEWIEQFYNKIINCTDPLAIYRTILHEHNNNKSKLNKPQKIMPPNQRKSDFGLFAIIIASLLLFFLLLLLQL